MTPTPTRDEILEFWLGPLDARGQADAAHLARWWKKDPAVDAEIRRRFGPAVDDAIAGRRPIPTDDARGILAEVILLDQFSRNVYRDDPRAFAGDARALASVRAALGRALDADLPYHARYFLYMPLMHAEDRAVQAEAVARFTALGGDAPDPRAGAQALDFARRHRDIVERFGRFPHRNAILGRPSTAEEVAFLAGPGSSF
jgi:uncharacterized protein (DUF924 family)